VTIVVAGADEAGVGQVGVREMDQGFDLVSLAAEAEEEDGGEVGMVGVSDKDAAKEVGGFAVLGHAAAGAVSDGDDAVDVGIGAEDIGGEVGGDAAGYGGGTVDRGEDADVVAGADAAVGADDSLEGGGGFEECGGVSFRADGVVALEVSGDEVVGVDEFASGDGLGGEADDLVELTDRLSGGDGAHRQLMSGRDVGERSQVQAVERLARGYWLEGDYDVVRASEFESVVAQTDLFFSKYFAL
jgi:hypothetical protein